MTTGSFRAGYCALVGLPNVGKSTLLNGLVGERLSIVTHKAQTTRQRLLGIYTDEEHQAVFVDTPGLLDPRYLLHTSMLQELEKATDDADVLVYVADVGWDRSLAAMDEVRIPPGVPAILCLNKIDRVGEDRVAELTRMARKSERWSMIRPTIARTGEGVADLKEEILAALPEHPPYFPPDEIATAPVRYFVAESIREACFEQLEEEIPYSTAVGIEEFREDREPVYVQATIFVERESQKGIVIGKGGSRIRQIGTAARKSVERFLGQKVYLDLRVKVLANWRRRPGKLRLLGYPVKLKEPRK